MLVNTLDLPLKLLERYEFTHGKENVKTYTGLLAYYALALAADCKKDSEMLKKCMDYLSRYPDHFDHPTYSFEAYRVGGNAKAFLLMKGYLPDDEARIREYAEKMYCAEADKDGLLCMPSFHWVGCEDWEERGVWIDEVSIVTPFMLFAGMALKEQKYVDFAVRQCLDIYDLLRNPDNGLVHQAKGFIDGTGRITEDHWSRGNGWGLVGLTELVQYLPKDHPERERVEQYFVKHVNAIIRYQGENGLWRQEITEPLSWFDSSGSGLILYGLGVGIRQGLLQDVCYRSAFEKGIDGLTKWCMTDNFATYSSSTGCLCPGTGNTKGTVSAYVNVPCPAADERHSYGCLALAFVEAHKNGIEEVELFRLQHWFNPLVKKWQYSV